MEGIAKFAERNWVKRVAAFLDGKWFPLCFGGLAFLFYALNLPVATLALTALVGGFICLFCKDTRPMLAVVLLLVITFRYKDNPEGYLSVFAIVVYALLGPPLLFAVIYRLVKGRLPLKDKTGLYCILFLAATFLVGGLFSKYYTLANIGYELAAIAISLLVFAFFALTMQGRGDTIPYFAKLCVVALGVITLEVAELYIRLYEWGTPLDGAWKGKITFGWSISNMVGEMMVVLLPAAFYLMYTQKKGYFYWFSIGAALIAVYFTFARNALLWGAIVLLVGTAINFFGGRSKKVNRFVVLVAFIGALGVLALLYFSGKLTAILGFFAEAGFSDRGRFNIWASHFGYFTDYPVFGAGFMAFKTQFPDTITYAHNIFVQILSSTGIVGLLLFTAHFSLVLYLAGKKRTAERRYLSGCLALVLLISMLSPFFFLAYATIYYTVILTLLDKNYEGEH